MDRETIRKMILELLEEEKQGCPVRVCRLGEIQMQQQDRLETGDPGDQVYTHDLFSLEESPRLGCGLMEMEQTSFPWLLQYDEIDYILSGELTIHCCGTAVTAGPGEVLLIPKGSHIRFSAKGKTRFLYVTYPADWKKQA